MDICIHISNMMLALWYQTLWYHYSEEAVWHVFICHKCHQWGWQMAAITANKHVNMATGSPTICVGNEQPRREISDTICLINILCFAYVYDWQTLKLKISICKIYFIKYQHILLENHKKHMLNMDANIYHSISVRKHNDDAPFCIRVWVDSLYSAYRCGWTSSIWLSL